MTIRVRTAFFIFLGLITLWFLIILWAILTPFILAAIFAYIFNPVVDFFTHKVKLPRALAIAIMYIFIISLVSISSLLLTRRLVDESAELKSSVTHLVILTRAQISTLPDILQFPINDALISLQRSRIFSPEYLFVLFPQAISRVVSILIFLFAGFYFLKEGKTMFDTLLLYAPNDYKGEVRMLAGRINAVLGGYLRGIIILVCIVSLLLFVPLSILGVKFALLLAIFSGFAEIVPIIGPILAASVAVVVVLITGQVNFDLYPAQGALIVIIIYFVVRHFQDYFITPYIMGKVTNLHPLVVLFAVLAGGHVAGIFGLVLGVPIAATVRILLEYSIGKINQRSKN